MENQDDIEDIDTTLKQDIEEDEPTQETLNKYDLHSFNNRFIQALILAVQDLPSGQELLSALSQCFQQMLILANTIPGSKIGKSLGDFATQLKQRVKDIEEDEALRNELVNNIIKVMVQEFSNLEGANTDGSSSFQIGYNGARAILDFIIKLFEKESVIYTQDLARILVSLTHQLKDQEKQYIKLTKHIFKSIQSFKDYNQESFKALLNELQIQSKYNYQALLANQANDDQSIKDLCERFKDIILDDKNVHNQRHIVYFIVFLNNLDEKLFSAEILPQIQFMLNRTSALIPNIALTFKHLNFKIKSLDFLKQITHEIISYTTITSEEQSKDCQLLFGQIARLIEDEEIAKGFIIDYLLKKFKEATSVTVVHRQNLVKHLREAILNLKPKTLYSDQIKQQVNTSLFDHILLIKDEPVIKDVFDPILTIILLSENLSYLQDTLKKLQTKNVNTWHVNLFNEIMLQSKIDFTDLLPILAIPFKQLIASENFKSSVNYSIILSLAAFFINAYNKTNDKQYLNIVLENENLIGYLTGRYGFVNTQAYFQKQPSLYDSKYHLLLIQNLIIIQQQQQHHSFSDAILRDTLTEYLLNISYRFREHQVFDCYEHICEVSPDSLKTNLLKSLKQKVKQIAQRPIVYSREELPFRVNLNVNQRVKQILKFILKERSHNTDISKEEFISLLKLISHPVLSSNQKELDIILNQMEDSLKSKEKTLPIYFELYGKDIAQYAIVERSGILNPNSTLRAIASNMLVGLGRYGQLNLFIGEIVQILNYKPLELSNKLLSVFQYEFDRISHYDLMFYSEITIDLLKVFKEKDEGYVKQELSLDQGEDSKEEEKQSDSNQEASTANIDPAKLAAQMMKKQAQAVQAKKTAATQGKGGAKPQAKAPAKNQASQKDIGSKKQDEPKQVDKEQRNKNDRHQIQIYIVEIQRIQGEHISTALDVVKRISSCKSAKNYQYLDLILSHSLQSLIKLLHFAPSKFSTLNFLNSLFSADQTTPFFKVKNMIVNSLIALSSDRIYQKTQRDYQAIFQHLESVADFQDLDKGYLQLILLMTNAVLKDLSVNLSVKEQALQVTSSILESNVKVQNIDLVRVTINMMKSSYSNDNLSSYLNKLLKRISLEELALMLQRLFEYEPIPRHCFLVQLLEHDAPLFCPVWFCTQIWILQFDEDAPIRTLSRKIWNKYGMVLRSGVLDLQREEEHRNIFCYLRFKNTNIFDASIKAAVSSIEIFQNRFDLIIDDLLEFYDKEMEIVEHMILTNVVPSNQQDPSLRNNPESQRKLILDDRYNRIAVPEILKRTAYLIQANSFKKVFDFLITKGCADQSENVQKASMDAAIQIIQSKGADYSEEILKILEKYINESKKYSEWCKNQAIIMIGSLATYLDNASQKKLIGTFEKMVELLHVPSELIRQSICKCIPQLARFFEERSRKMFDEHFKILRESNDDKILRGSAYAVAGIIKGLGMQTFHQLNILEIVNKECFSSKADPFRKVSGLYLYETLSFSLGRTFEMQIEKILPNILSSISDQKEQVRKAGNQTNKAIMSRFSNHTIKQVLPLFLKGLETDNWRGKLAAVDALGNMAYCAPKQIATYLPQIVKGIREVLNDTHEKVHAAAMQAIENIGSVIKCPEIADILEILVKSLSNPNQFLKQALKTLLDTSFVHAIDAPSLSLLIPILDSGLMMHDNDSKRMAAKLMGNICDLTQNPEDLLPYMKILMPAIKNSLFDSIPEIRASAAKALGSLSKGLGFENSQEMLQWLRQVLHQKGLATSERSGAAQGFAEVISAHGVKFFEEIIQQEVMLKYQDADPGTRESYRSVMVFLPTSFDHFVKYLPMLLPLMIEGISDDIEEIRKISLRNVKICIKQFGKQAPIQLVQPIMMMMYDRDFRVRQSSSILMYQLVKELENDIIKSQPKFISQETKQEILSSMFMLKYDTIERVATQASQIWKNIIDNQMKVLRQVIQVLIKQVFFLVQSEFLELSEMGLNCMRGIVEKFGEKIVGESLDIFESYLERATDAGQTVGISKALYNMAEASPLKLLHDIRNRIISIIEPNIYHEIVDVRYLAGKVFTTIFQKIYEPQYISSTLDKYFLKKLHQLIQQGQKEEAERVLVTLKEMIKEEGLKLEDKLLALCEVQIHSSPFTIAQARVIRIVAPNVAHLIFKKKFYNSLLTSLLSELEAPDIHLDDQTRVNAVLYALAELLCYVPEPEIATLNMDTIDRFYVRCKELGRLNFYVDFLAYYCRFTICSYEDFAQDYLRNVMILMNDTNTKLLDSVVDCMNAIFDKLPKESQFYLVPLIRQVIEQLAVTDVGLKSLYQKKVETIRLLEKPNGVKSLVTVIQNSIMHGSIEVRIDSAICFKYLIEFAKPDAIKSDIIKICGALIRVVNDKFPAELKLQIFLALKLILVKASAAVKAMVPQLQTTFLKAFNDVQGATYDVRKLVVENLLLLVKITPKSDPIVKELASLLEGEKLEKEARVEVAEVLALIIKQDGKKIQQSMGSQIQQTLTQIIEQKKSFYNEKTLANCAAALAFLSPNLPEGVTYSNQLFEIYDELAYPSISVGLKVGVILNSPTAPNAFDQTLVQKLKEYCFNLLNKETGLVELDQKPQKDDLYADSGTLYGIFDVIGHVTNTFVRRFVNPDSEFYKMFFNVINEAQIFEVLNQQSSLSKQTFKQVQNFLASIPIKLGKDGKFDPDVAQVIKDGLEFIRTFYLEFDSKKEAQEPLHNLLMLNFDNYLDINDDKKLIQITKEKVREHCAKEQFKDIVDKDMIMISVELIFFH